jgi:hypothetical protein
MWPTLLVTLLVAFLVTLPVIWLLGWRRPGAPQEESTVLSGVFLFVLVFLATWALMGWLAPWGPAVSGVRWLLLLVGAALVALFVLVAGPTPSSSVAANAAVDQSRGTEAAEGVGVMFWVLVILLLIVGVVGNTQLLLAR